MSFSQPYQAMIKQYRLVLTALRTPKLREQFIGLLSGSTEHAEGPWKELPWLSDGAVDDAAITANLELLKTLLGPYAVIAADTVKEMPANSDEREQLLRDICRRVFTAMPQSRDWLTEEELNSRLAMLVDDVATVRRYSVDLGLLRRSDDASRYQLGSSLS
ncbi:DUF2087 domain-containing protein [Bifidobacterium choloepi]|uniref:DUF2087 domain-containing protein n=1 Tax=Bifidobacterium choloepi TaxID=2614131 RepID=A0A6I5NG01_9BIFI|nr:DUF2087 domain-containing protein [Bifidobacterium choloepi]NEG70274.1 DUF2087 domain-containing protein [Bifidobacterium choloepi]